MFIFAFKQKFEKPLLLVINTLPCWVTRSFQLTQVSTKWKQRQKYQNHKSWLTLYFFTWQVSHKYKLTYNLDIHISNLSGSWDWIKNLLSLVPKADIKIVQLDLLGVVMVFFSLISYLQICFSLHFHTTLCQHAIYIGFFIPAWAFCLSLVQLGSKCVSAWSDWLNKQTNNTNKQTNKKQANKQTNKQTNLFFLGGGGNTPQEKCRVWPKHKEKRDRHSGCESWDLGLILNFLLEIGRNIKQKSPSL